MVEDTAVEEATDSQPDTEEASQPDVDEQDQFELEQKAKAEAQNQHGANAVPEQRPIASQESLPSHQSDTVRRLREEGALEEEPMGKDAYDRASSGAQAKAAASASRTPGVEVGTRVQIVDGPHRGRNAHILRIEYPDFKNEQLATSGTSEARFAEVSGYVVETRDGRKETVEVTPDQVRVVPANDWGRSAI